MKELQHRAAQARRPVRYYIVKTEHDDQPVVRSVSVFRPAAPPVDTVAASVEASIAVAAEGGSDREQRPDRRPTPTSVGRLARAAAAIRRHPAGQ